MRASINCPRAEVALWSALIIGVGGGGGALLGGAIVDRLARKDRRWYGWAPGAACLLAAPFGLAQFLVPDLRLSIGIGFVATSPRDLEWARRLCATPSR